jgi:ribosomal protein L7/L12
MKYDIFISYRRIGGKDKARPLKSELEKRGYKVFLDFDDLKDSVFDKRIMDAIDEAPVFLIILSAHALDRCKNENDWVRKEIEYAEMKKKHFVPVNPDKEFDGFPEDTPFTVKQCLGQHQFSSIDFEQLFQPSIDMMVEDRIKPIIIRMRKEEKSMVGALVRIETDLDCRVLRFKEEIAVAKAGDIAEIRLPKGKHKLTFISVDDNTISDSMIYEVTDIDYEDFLEIGMLGKYNEKKEKEQKEQKRLEQERIKRGNVVDRGVSPNGTYDIVLKSSGQYKLAVVKMVKDFTNLGLKEAKELVDKLPNVVKLNVSIQEACLIKRSFEEVGAIVEMKKH